jgi:hypothetical protein
LLGNELSDGVELGSLLGIYERLGWIEGPSLVAADLFGAELGMTLGAADRLGGDDGSLLGTIVLGWNEADGVGFGEMRWVEMKETHLELTTGLASSWDCHWELAYCKFKIGGYSIFYLIAPFPHQLPS